MGVTGDQATTRPLGTQPFGHMHAEVAARIGVAGPAICHGMTADSVSDLDLSDSGVDVAAGHGWLQRPATFGRPGLEADRGRVNEPSLMPCYEQFVDNRDVNLLGREVG